MYFKLAIIFSVFIFVKCGVFVDDDVEFTLYRKDVPDISFSLEEISDYSQNSYLTNFFVPTIPTQIYMHGFQSNTNTGQMYCEELFKVGDVNCITVDWSNWSGHVYYYNAKSKIKLVSKKLAKVIDTLVGFGINTTDLTLIGHSLGAHLAGLASKKVKSGKVGTIIGLDPASPGFSILKPNDRLNKHDADYVLVIHTNTGMYGMAEPIGHADVYPNFGEFQPGCYEWPLFKYVNPCSHSRAQELLLESITTNFVAIQCTWRDVLFQKAHGFTVVRTILGPNMTKERGLFYLETKVESPFVISDHRMFKNSENTSDMNQFKKRKMVD